MLFRINRRLRLADLIEELTGNKFEPTIMIADGADSIRNAFYSVFPSAKMLGARVSKHWQTKIRRWQQKSTGDFGWFAYIAAFIIKRDYFCLKCLLLLNWIKSNPIILGDSVFRQIFIYQFKPNFLLLLLQCWTIKVELNFPSFRGLASVLKYSTNERLVDSRNSSMFWGEI